MRSGFFSSSSARTSSQAAGSGFYFGAGVSDNELNGFDDATGFQVFGGIPLPIDTGAVKSAVEVGYMDSGDFEHKVCWAGSCWKAEDSAEGVWANYVAAVPLSNNFDLVGRVGADFGDDDGFMAGVGAGFHFTPLLELRGEYVVRDNIDSLQLNVVFRP